ncbi:MAG: OmpH family outer membrane protein [Planctomycetes bacterium]|nr:OmpH family outer membrane protein [Planctomycetota bacterium]
MKIKITIISCLIAAAVLVMGAKEEKTESQSAQIAVMKIGVVNVREIFQNCKRNESYRQQATAEQDKIIAELEKLAKEIEAEKAGLKTLKVGSSDYMELMKELMSKQANLQAQQEFYKQQIELKDQQWTEKLYEDILRQTAIVAEQNRLAVVFEKDEIDLPAANANDLMLTIRTHKILYSGGAEDITAEVMEKLNVMESEKPNQK